MREAFNDASHQTNYLLLQRAKTHKRSSKAGGARSSCFVARRRSSGSGGVAGSSCRVASGRSRVAGTTSGRAAGAVAVVLSRSASEDKHHDQGPQKRHQPRRPMGIRRIRVVVVVVVTVSRSLISSRGRGIASSRGTDSAVGVGGSCCAAGAGCGCAVGGRGRAIGGHSGGGVLSDSDVGQVLVALS